MDGVWLPAGGRRPETRGCPGSRHKPGPGIAKGEACSPLTRPRQQQVGIAQWPTRAEPAKPKHRELRLLLQLPGGFTETSRHRPGRAAVDRPGPRDRETALVSLSHQRHLAVIFPL